MHQQDEHDLATSFKDKAFTFLDAQTLPPTPVNYAVAYCFSAQRNAKLVKDIMEFTKIKQPISGDLMIEWYDRHLSSRDTFERDIIAPMDRMMGSVLNTMTSKASADEQFVSELAGLDEQLSGFKEGDDINAVLSEMQGIGQRAQQEHQSLIEELHKATEEINALKDKLETTRQEALSDPLTGLLNRRGLSQKIQNLKPTEDCACLLMDIDHFKKINDNYGHFIGDLVIKRVAKVISENVRGGDLSVRFGGEEFLVLLTDTPAAGAKTVAEIIRKKVSELRLVQKSSNDVLPEVNISIGIAMRQPDEEWEHLYKRGDDALYQAKERGRNRAVLVEGEVDPEYFELPKQA